jgi:hypothetical protein
VDSGVGEGRRFDHRAHRARRAHREERQREKMWREKSEFGWPDGTVFGSFGGSVYVARPEGG